MKPHVLALLTAFHASAAAAQECSPLNFLKPETLHSLGDLTTRISYVDAYHRQSPDKRKSKFIGDVFSPWGISGLDEKQAKLVSDLIKSLVNLQIDERTQDWLLVSTLSKTGIDEYRDCHAVEQEAFLREFFRKPDALEQLLPASHIASGIFRPKNACHETCKQSTARSLGQACKT